MDTMIELPAMRRSAELAPNTADADTRTVEVVWSAGARIRRATFFGEPYDEELSLDPAHVRLDRLNAGAPFLKVHELDTLDAVIGSVVPGSARIENGRGIALVRISERADVEPIWRDIQAGHIRAVSIGYQVHRFEVSKPEAARELWRAVDWTPFEVSAVAVGADPAAGFRAQHPLHDCVLHRRDAPTPQGPSPMTDKTQTPASDAATPATTQPTEPNDTEDTTMTEPKEAAPEPKVAASEMRSQPKTQATPAPDTEAVVTRAREAERDRVSTIYDLAGRLNLERGFAEDLVKRGVSVDESRRLILDQVAAKSDETRTFGHVSVPLGGRDERITRIPAMYGNSIAQLESDVVWGIITANPAMADGNALFHTTHKNLAGTGTALAVEAVGAARAAMAKQTGLDKKTVLNVRPAFLIVPASLELKAEQLVAQNLVPAATSSVVPQSIRTLAPISEPRLDANSETAWYLAASPNQIDTIKYAYLEGQQGAYIETRNGFDVDGVEIKCRLDFGAKAIDWRGLYKNPGA